MPSRQFITQFLCYQIVSIEIAGGAGKGRGTTSREGIKLGKIDRGKLGKERIPGQKVTLFQKKGN
ncbi:MAG: hypothetical protein GXO98_02510 [Nitrospirae bacterium]|nr:hypothetical protein [Nitrospirota bacterium]